MLLLVSGAFTVIYHRHAWHSVPCQYWAWRLGPAPRAPPISGYNVRPADLTSITELQRLQALHAEWTKKASGPCTRDSIEYWRTWIGSEVAESNRTSLWACVRERDDCIVAYLALRSRPNGITFIQEWVYDDTLDAPQQHAAFNALLTSAVCQHIDDGWMAANQEVCPIASP